MNLGKISSNKAKKEQKIFFQKLKNQKTSHQVKLEYFTKKRS